ncbi:DUF4271 domain-containing protein [Niabella defluvii]|nr:DUF4271 domain-containing protein [Niabella sp. I65]
MYFYIVTGLFLLFAIFKASFDKYFTDLINLFFRRSLKQRQLKQQVVQNSLPSLLFNILFVITAGFYGAMAIQKNLAMTELPLWQLFIYLLNRSPGSYLSHQILYTEVYRLGVQNKQTDG